MTKDLTLRQLSSVSKFKLHINCRLTSLRVSLSNNFKYKSVKDGCVSVFLCLSFAVNYSELISKVFSSGQWVSIG